MRPNPWCTVLVCVAILPLFACKSKATVCENARDRFVELIDADAQLAEAAAPDDQKSVAREIGDEMTEVLRQGFVEPCLEFDDKQLECMAKIDGYADAMLAVKRASLECDPLDEACNARQDPAIRAAKDSYTSDCVKVLDLTFTILWSQKPR